MSGIKVTVEELSQHNSREDLWLAIDGKVYDMTAYLSSHPGGDAMLRQAGKDGTLGFSAVQAHSTVSGFIKTKLESCLVGLLDQ